MHSKLQQTTPPVQKIKEATPPAQQTEEASPPVQKTEETTQPVLTEEATQPEPTEETTQPVPSEEATQPEPTEEATQPVPSEEATQPVPTEEATQPVQRTEETPPSVQQTEHARVETPPEETLSIERYAATLVHEDELSELILQLESALERSLTSVKDPGLVALVRHTGLDLTSPGAVRGAIVLLGERLQRLQTVRHTRLALPSLPAIERRDARGLTEGLTDVLDGARLEVENPETTLDILHRAVDEALELFLRNQPSRSEEDTEWWTLARAAIHDRLVPGFDLAAQRLQWLEGYHLWRTLVRSPWLMALATGLLGLLTFFLPVPTPLVMILMGLLGAFVIHPVWLDRVMAPLNRVKDNFRNEIEGLELLTHEDPWPEETFALQGVLNHLLPVLEGERLAGHSDEAQLRLATSKYFDRIAPHFAESSSRGERYFEHLRDFCEHHVVRRFKAYAEARNRLDAHPLRFVLDSRGLTAFLSAVVTLPVSWIASRISPFPQAFDFPMMILLFLVLGWYLPRLVEGAQVNLEALKEELVEHQGKLDVLP